MQIAPTMSLPARAPDGLSASLPSATELLQPQSEMQGQLQVTAVLASTCIPMTDCVLCRGLP